MHIRKIKNLEVFDVQHLKGRTQTTWVSLQIDGIPVYSLAIRGIIDVHGGENTVGAFQTEDSQSIFAWTDPVSGVCHLRVDTALSRILPIIFMVNILVSVGIISLGLQSPYPQILVIGILIIAFMIARRIYLKCKVVETNLRAALAQK